MKRFTEGERAAARRAFCTPDIIGGMTAWGLWLRERSVATWMMAEQPGICELSSS